MEDYFLALDNVIKGAYEIAGKARKKCLDPENKVDIPLATGIGKRVEGLVSVEVGQVFDSGIAERIKELETEYGILDWRIALKIAEETLEGKFCSFKNEKEAMETAIRVGFAYLTLGVVSAPLEGFIELKIKDRGDGKKYLSAWYAGPIRGAGGTAAAFSVILVDYVRKLRGYDVYDPTDLEIKRYVTELRDYHERVTNLQYMPNEKEVEFLMERIPVEINGDPTEKIEVSNYKDLSRVETNRLRGGVALVIAEGIAQKSGKLWKRLAEWGKDFGLEWGFLKDFLKLQKKIKAGKGEEEKLEEGISPDFTFISDLVAGRPVLTHPLAKGGFRLRYGRSRLSGYSSRGIHPLTMFVLNNFIAIGTQLKVERPGKSTVLSVCDDLEGPLVRLKNGDVLFLDVVKNKLTEIEEILFLGDMLVNYGDFSENNHVLVPVGYCEEWWIEDVKKKVTEVFGGLDFVKLSSLVGLSEKELEILFENPINKKISADIAIRFSKKLDIPLHPRYTYHWKDINKEQFLSLLEWFSKGIIEKDRLILPLIFNINSDLREIDVKRVLELLGIPHVVINKESVVVQSDDCKALLCSLGYYSKDISDFEKVKESKSKDVLVLVNILSEVKLRDKSGTFIGARMGRPEKAKMRKLTGSPHVLFPVGKEGGRLRSFQSALEKGQIIGDFPNYFCEKCNRETVFFVCDFCGGKTRKLYFCEGCKKFIRTEECGTHGKCSSYNKRSINIKEIFSNIKKNLDLRFSPDLIKGVRGTSNKNHIPEHLGKGILRALHNVYVNKDGTIRYDMTEMALTHFKAKEIGSSIKKLKELGYKNDVDGKELVSNDQLIELKVQDVILPACEESLEDGADKVFFRVSKFIDDLLVMFYGEKAYYHLENKEDLVGHLVISLAPHTSAGVVGRIIGFSKTQGFLAHPLYHAAHRRDCDGDEIGLMLLMDGLLNFSRQYLPDKRGGRSMDAPLVISSKIIPSEVDDMVHGMDVVWKYPLELYEAAETYKYPYEVKIRQLKDRLETEKEYYDFGFTHNVEDLNKGVRCSAYKLLPTMEEKVKGQMEIAEKIRAVNEMDVARLVIEKHFIRDIRGNLRKFSMQQFRCVKCNEKFRRPPLSGICGCGGNIIFTIFEGGITKYLEPAISLAERYALPPYLKQSLELVKMKVESIFGKDPEKQEGLGKWF